MSDTEIVYTANEVYKRLGVSGSTQMFVLQHLSHLAYPYFITCNTFLILRTLPVKHATSFPSCVLFL
ncbi:hypothetical protein EXW27_29455 (plasmid) [Bacillus mycoides]|nr:hypothetical protein EXW27_29455 [Bacillus mycoides]TXR81487.1 hypothetical protein DN408_13055 [Bacillus sp. AR13-1]